MWLFLIGVITGVVIGVFLIAMMSAAPDPEKHDKAGGDQDED